MCTVFDFQSPSCGPLFDKCPFLEYRPNSMCEFVDCKVKKYKYLVLFLIFYSYLKIKHIFFISDYQN